MMDRPFIFNVLLAFIFILMLPALIRASVPIKKETITVTYSLKNSLVFLIDTAKHQSQDEKKDRRKKTSDHKEKPENEQQPNKPDIQEVPKARKQSRPPVVVKPNIKVKPIKVIRPNIKRP